MLCPAAVSAAAAAVWLLAVLGPGLSLQAEDNSESGFSLCSQCFYRQTPPQGASAGPLLRPLCHRLPGGQALATLYKPTCDTVVYSAFHLSSGWTKREHGEELVAEDEDNSKVAVPALLRGDGGVSPPDSPLLRWDSAVTTLVQSSISPQCSTLKGDLYILIGAGGLGAAEDGDEECQMKPLWSAVCCAVPEGEGSFSKGLIRETGQEDRHVSIKELEELLGATVLFSEGCGGESVETGGVLGGLHSEGHPGNVDKMDADASSEDEGETADQDTGIETLDAQPEEADEITRETLTDALKSESRSEEEGDVRRSGAVRSESPESPVDYETVNEEETDTNSSSTLFYILSTTVSILKAPLHPVVSTVTQLPGQVTYVLQEDLGVLSSLPGETFSFFHLVTSDLLSWIGSAAELLLGVGETCFFSAYYCTSSMVGALLSSCHTGVTGVGTLAGDSVGVVGDVVDNAWWVTKFFGGRLWEQSEGYVGAVVSEMGGQAKAVGGGFGKLAWRTGNGVYNVFSLAGGLIMGIADIFVGIVREAFGQESE